jgi:two-component system response regulator PilR (NtrC family)
MMEERAWDTALAPAAVAASLAHVLVVDDEPSMRQMLSIALRREGYQVTAVDDGRAALATLEEGAVDVVVTDVRMPEFSGVDLLREAKRVDPAISVIMMTAYGSKETVLEALRLGATDYVEKTHNLKDELALRIRKELDRKRLQQENVLLKRTLQSSHQFSNIIGSSDPMLALFQLVETIAPTSSTVLITGESGTGKELVARAIHFNSPRKDRPFVALNCGALSETLLDSELFGHVRGAFTGADTNKKGLIEVAEKGTIFLDEIGEMSPVVQVKLLRVLQERKFRRLGGTDEVDADIRIITATNRDLAKMVEDGRFRQDLYYRINVINVHLPPLRDRRDDIPLLAEHFVVRFARQMGKPITGISGDAMGILRRYHWPGNIRELENAMERAVALERSAVIMPESLSVASGKLPEPLLPAPVSLPEVDEDRLPDGFDLEQHVQEIEREYIAEALRRAGGVKVRAAELLGMSFRSFRYYTKKYNLG